MDLPSNPNDPVETEFIGATLCACQVIWLKRVLGKLYKMQSKATVIRCDSNSTIKLSKNPVMDGRCKHIDVRFHFLRGLTKVGTIEMMHCDTQEQVADIMTKQLKLDTARPRGERTPTCKEEELGCSDRPRAASDHHYSSHLRYGEMGLIIYECGSVR
ncbi:hypothetical protein CR513_43696, partial [Mucuna pruriens]